VLGGEDADAGWKTAVEGSMEIGGGDRRGQGEGGDLGKGMDTGVGAAGALGEDALAGGVVDGLGEHALNGGQVGLHLPSVVGRSVVGEGELPVSHAVLWTVSRGS
jgi:hypothetical protein